uniref:Uncharacterized protein n=1 Tax=viral metagenome TaxID=1070528 RepID=A0A6M3JWK6_9ZZZZ
MSKRRRNKEERDRKPNPYWNETDDDEHAMIEDDYGENSDADSICGRQKQEFDPYKFDDRVWKNPYRKYSIRRSLEEI